MNGIIVINKEIGYTSRDVVNIVSKQLGTKKVGHTGTLDPNASGVLVLCVGNALKLCELLTDHDKEYIAGITLGISTDTLDMDGTIISTQTVDVPTNLINDAVVSFKGSYMQEVPMYSAVKVNGKKLYEYARKNIEVKLPIKPVNIFDIEIIDDIVYNEGKVNFSIKTTVSKGTYIRSLVRDIGKRLGVHAVMNSLIRKRLGNFRLENAISIDDVKKNKISLIPTIDALPEMKRIVVNDDIAFKVKNGVVLDKFFDEKMAFILDKSEKLLAIYENIDGKARVYKMFN